MNTTTHTIRLTAAAAAAALAMTFAGASTAGAAPLAGGPRAHEDVARPVTTPAMHRELVQEAADRYVVELLVRHRMADEASTTVAAAPVDDDLSPSSHR